MLKKLAAAFNDLERGRRGSFGNDISTPENRRAALWHFHLFDHAILRGLWTNLEQIAPGVWRSNQPSPARIERYAKMGIKTILNLRGTPKVSHYLLEEETCAAHGIELVSIALAARAALPKENYLEVIDLLDRLEKPFLFHCKSGADRAGLVAALYLLHVENAPLDVARKQLSLRFLHLKSTKTGVLDHILDCYEADMARLGPMGIRDWFADHYDQAAVRASFKPLWNRS
ncbi:protein tyrosine phosphatase [Litorivita pollutaquae]|uniref:Protein tyrosine phosphatase n=1 Tax=Litorivita pollutaquae TaxID=2200892 RepID=A0A2V4MMN5_9RHOB|nr:tyrosine-protein phosphatase [Litorivita pollutaquae]PYC47971.1 protein tyrosine phosphatase [Litorivita pollutaquae]